VLKACPRPGVRARVLLAWVRSPGESGDFSGTEFSAGTGLFGGATFSGGIVDFTGATFSGGEIRFSRARFSGGTVDFSIPSDWSVPPAFPWLDTPPSGVRLPKKDGRSQT